MKEELLHRGVVKCKHRQIVAFGIAVKGGEVEERSNRVGRQKDVRKVDPTHDSALSQGETMKVGTKKSR